MTELRDVRPVTLPPMSNDDVQGLSALTRLLMQKEQQRHDRRMDVLAFISGVAVTLFCLVSALVLALNGEIVACSAFLAAPVATMLIRQVGRVSTSSRKAPSRIR